MVLARVMHTITVDDPIPADFARQLERELGEEKKRNAELSTHCRLCDETNSWARECANLRAQLAAQPNKEKELRELLQEAGELLEVADHLMRASDNMRHVHDGKHDYLWENLSNAANQYRAKSPAASSAALYNRIRALLATPPAAPRTEGTSDTEMLDWFEKNGRVAARYQALPPASDHTGPVHWLLNWNESGTGGEHTVTFRQAILAAMSADSPPQSGRKGEGV